MCLPPNFRFFCQCCIINTIHTLDTTEYYPVNALLDSCKTLFIHSFSLFLYRSAHMIFDLLGTGSLSLQICQEQTFYAYY